MNYRGSDGVPPSGEDDDDRPSKIYANLEEGQKWTVGSFALVYIHLSEDHEQTPKGNTREQEGMEERDRHSSYDLKRRGPREPLAAIDGFSDRSLRLWLPKD
ncbi:hypothetical protein OPV22_035145 [Ensete ventricosum]|uniref:Uncharacterized protein n=1 Tax=Ensete ventricosum TaxID=4639 RepID=A0AAX5NIT1_ENSVE|nr:hypothetical protein OPV22_035145 [Ensete ventricosum]